MTTEEHNLVRLQRSTTWCDYRGAQLGVLFCVDTFFGTRRCLATNNKQTQKADKAQGVDKTQKVDYIQEVDKHKKQTKHRK